MTRMLFLLLAMMIVTFPLLLDIDIVVYVLDDSRTRAAGAAITANACRIVIGCPAQPRNNAGDADAAVDDDDDGDPCFWLWYYKRQQQ